MLRVFVATTKWSDDYIPSGEKIIMADSRTEAEQILQEWTKNYLKKQRQKHPKHPNVLEWRLEERPLEKGILWEDGIQWLSETP